MSPVVDDRDRSRVPVFGARVEGCPYVIRPIAYAILRNAAGQCALARTPKGVFLLGGAVAPLEHDHELAWLDRDQAIAAPKPAA